jgi:hypothetical protein
MSLVKILDIDVHFLKAAAGDQFMNEVSRKIRSALEGCGEPAGRACPTHEMEQLLVTIEAAKYRFLRQQITARQLYREVVESLDQFKAQYPGFDHLRDPLLNAYYS